MSFTRHPPGEGDWRQQQQMLRILGAEDVAQVGGRGGGGDGATQEVLLAAAQEVLRQQGEEVSRRGGRSASRSLNNGVRWLSVMSAVVRCGVQCTVH